jgi:putative hydrolase of the HAD superfamily
VTATATLAQLVDGVELLCLDAGNVVIFFDHARLASYLRREGFETTSTTLIRCEGEAKTLQERRALVDVAWEGRDRPGGRGWGAMIGTMCTLAGFPYERLPELLATVWREHLLLNIWSIVPPGLPRALAHARARGARVAIVSNSEGMLEPFFAQLGILGSFDAIVDSGKVGVEKPDPRIFEIAVERCRATKETTLHLGDSMATDIEGARAAGIRYALVDPHGHVAGRYPDVPRVSGAVDVAEAIAAARK